MNEVFAIVKVGAICVICSIGIYWLGQGTTHAADLCDVTWFSDVTWFLTSRDLSCDLTFVTWYVT